MNLLSEEEKKVAECAAIMAGRHPGNAIFYSCKLAFSTTPPHPAILFAGVKKLPPDSLYCATAADNPEQQS
jgi:hypothetical protein